MAEGYRLELRGGKVDLADIVGLVSEATLRAAARAGTEEGEKIMARSKEIVPVDTGTLQASADAVGVNVLPAGDGIEIAFGYGGAASGYSIIQHEVPPPGSDDDWGEMPGVRYSHTPGRTYKFLERPVMEATEGFESRMAARMRELIEGDVGGAS